MTDPAELQELLDAIHLAQDCLGKHYAREMKDGSRPIWTALDWCERWFSDRIIKNPAWPVERPPSPTLAPERERTDVDVRSDGIRPDVD